VRAISESYAQLDRADDLIPGLVLLRAKNPDLFLLTAGKIRQTTLLKCENALVNVLRRTFADKAFVAIFLNRILVDKDV